MVISGLSLSNRNDQVAIDILQKRFNDTQQLVRAHYQELMNISRASNYTLTMSATFGNVETHIRGLQALYQDIDQEMFNCTVETAERCQSLHRNTIQEKIARQFTKTHHNM